MRWTVESRSPTSADVALLLELVLRRLDEPFPRLELAGTGRHDAVAALVHVERTLRALQLDLSVGERRPSAGLVDPEDHHRPRRELEGDLHGVRDGAVVGDGTELLPWAEIATGARSSSIQRMASM